MLHKKKGFTLIEVIVVMLVATLVFTMVGGTMVFITTTTGDLIHQAEEIDMAKNIAKYLRANCDNLIIIDNNGGNVQYSLNIDELNDAFSNASLPNFEIIKEDQNSEFIKCKMTFTSGREFEFIIDTVEKQTVEVEVNQ